MIVWSMKSKLKPRQDETPESSQADKNSPLETKETKESFGIIKKLI